RYTRLSWALLGLVPLGVIITATMLTPDVAGHGTHMQLGLPPCGVLFLTGYPCPGRGLSTCIARMVRFELGAAAAATAFGVPLFLASLATIPISAVGFARRLPLLGTLARLQADRVVILLAVCSMAVWFVRIASIAFAR